MKRQVKIVANILFVMAFLGLLIGSMCLNAEQIFGLLKSADKSADNWQKSAASVESSLKEKTVGRDKLIDLYGLSLVLQNRNIVGDFEFVKDKAGIIQRFEAKIDEDRYVDYVRQLQEVAEKKSMPFVHAVLPNKAKYLMEITDEMRVSGTLSYIIKDRLQKCGTDCLDFDMLLKQEDDAPAFDDFYFKTDVHNTTYAEFWVARNIVRYLSENYQVSFPNSTEIFNLENYTVTTYDFIGNTARSSGRYFSGIDMFDIYYPKFETSLTLSVPLSSVSRTGDFEKVMLNGYEKRTNYSEYTYWITNFGQYPSPYYQYTNLAVDENAPKLLIITDSCFMRGLSYLALACREVTVLDPRYFSGIDYVASELQFEDYDATVIVGSSNTFFNSKLVSDISLPAMPQKDMITTEKYGEWIANQGICLDTYNDKRLEGSTTITIDSNASFVKLYGWAADFCNDAPFKELYLQVGDVLLLCNNFDRTSVVDHFHKESLLKTGFQVVFPASYLKDGEVTEVSFIGVSSDGQYLYEPVPYKLLYT